MTKFVDGAGLAYFKKKIDGVFLNKNEGGTVEGETTFSANVNVTGNIVGTNTGIKGIDGITAHTLDNKYTQVWNDRGGRISIGAAGGLATLDASGKIPLSQLGNIDTTFVEVVTKLPETNIGKHMYLLAEAAASNVNQNKYAEYIYTGTLPISDSNKYDAAKWEKLGDFQAEVDLAEYAKKENAVASLSVSADSDDVTLYINSVKGEQVGTQNLGAATTKQAGVMTAADKSILTKLANRYPFDISSFSASPSVAELGVATSVTLNWGYQNEDFHTVSSQSVKGTHGISGEPTVAVGTKTYSISGNNAITVTRGKDRVTATFTLTSKADNNATTKSRTASVVFVHPAYCGVVDAANTAITSADISKLTKQSISNSKNRTVSITQTNQKLVYVYPAYFGDLTSIKDGNGFQGISGYTKSTLDMDDTTYNVYLQNTPATATGSYTFA